MSLYTIKAAFVITGTERIAAKYYTDDWPTIEAQRKLENKLIAQRSTHQSDAVVFDDVLAIYRINMGTFFCVVGDVEENPFILEAALDALYQATSLLLHGQVDKRTLLENLDYVMLVIDEVVDDGIILESNASSVAQRVALRELEPDVPIGEQTIADALKSARGALDQLLNN